MKRLLGAVLISLCLSGAAAFAAPERVGVVHAQQILAQMPEFQKYSQEYAADQARLASAKGKDRADISASMKKWESIRDKFVTHTMTEMQTAAKKVEKDKGLAYVLLDAPWSGTGLSQEGAVDVTTDVIFAMRGQ